MKVAIDAARVFSPARGERVAKADGDVSVPAA